MSKIIHYRPTDLDKIEFWGRSARSKKRLKKFNELQGKPTFSKTVETIEKWQKIKDYYEQKDPTEKYLTLTKGE